jgi:hypothetical protein
VRNRICTAAYVLRHCNLLMPDSRIAWVIEWENSSRLRAWFPWMQEVLLEALEWLPRSHDIWHSATLLPLCEVAGRGFLSEDRGSALTDYQDHDALVSSALQRISATLWSGPAGAGCDRERLWAAAVDAACCALDNYSVPPACIS